MNDKITGNIINIPVRKPTAEEVERNQQKVSKLMDRMKREPALLKRYADLTTGKFQELLEMVQRIGLDTVGTFKQVWEEQEGGQDFPLNNEQTGYAAMTTLNVVAVAYALGVMAAEADEHTFTQAEIDKLWSDAGEDFELPVRNGNERGN